MTAAPPARLSARVSGIAESATLAVTARAKALRAAGQDVIGFGAGEPDFPTPRHVVEAAQRACAEPWTHRYTPAGGTPALREAVAQVTSRSSGTDVAPSSVVITNGGKQAVYEAFAALLDPGDEVLLPSPWWTTYPEAVRLAGGVVVEVPTDETSGYLVDVASLERALTPRTKVLLLCSPSNPTGAVLPRETVEAIGRFAVEHGLWVVSDEIYEHLVYDGAEAVGVVRAVPETADRCVVVNGVAKTYAMTGWRVGWLVGPPDVSRGVVNLQSHLTSNPCNVAQAAALAALTGQQDDVARMREAFDRRRRLMVQRLSEVPGVVCPTPLGAFYCYPSVAGLLDRPLRGRVAGTSAELAELVLEEAGVALVPGEAFGTPGHVRLSYALSDEDLVEGLRRLAELVEQG